MFEPASAPLSVRIDRLIVAIERLTRVLEAPEPPVREVAAETCRKCGGAIAPTYCTKRCHDDGAGVVDDLTSRDDPPFPHLHRTCRACGFDTLAPCLDAEGDPTDGPGHVHRSDPDAARAHE